MGQRQPIGCWPSGFFLDGALESGVSCSKRGEIVHQSVELTGAISTEVISKACRSVCGLSLVCHIACAAATPYRSSNRVEWPCVINIAMALLMADMTGVVGSAIGRRYPDAGAKVAATRREPTRE